MNAVEVVRTAKNLKHWVAFIEKVERKAKAAKRKLTAEEVENLEMRRAQCVVWSYQLKGAQAEGLDEGSLKAGDISATSGVSASENASV